MTMIRIAAAIVAASLAAGTTFAQSTSPLSDKPETSCTTTPAASSGSGDEKTSNAMAMEKSAIVPEAGGKDSAAPTIQSGGKPMEIRSDCQPDSKPK